MVRPTHFYMNPFELTYNLFRISLSKCTGSCNVLSSKICVLKEPKGINVKVFNMKTKKNEATEMTEQISCDSKFESNSTTFNSKQKLNNKTCQCECKHYCKCKKIIVWILVHIFVTIVSI